MHDLDTIRAAVRSAPLRAYELFGLRIATQNGHEARGPCPLHGGERPDSFVVTTSGERAGLFHCFSCNAGGDLFDFVGRRRYGETWKSGRCNGQVAEVLQEVASALGHSQANGGSTREEIPYDYPDEDGNLLYQVVRYTPKRFVQRRRGANGKWVYNLRGVRRVLYRLPDLLAADPSQQVFLPEGEKDVDNLVRRGLLATTAPGGAGKWRPEYSEFFAGRDVVILADADVAGRRDAEQKAAALDGIAKTVRVLELPGLAESEDVSDWLERGNSSEALVELAEQAEPWSPDAKTGSVSMPYRATDFGLVHDKTTSQGIVTVPLSNFTAEIVADIAYDDGVERSRVYELRALHAGRVRTIRISANSFAGMDWVSEQLGADAIVYAGFSTKDHARVAIQVLSVRIDRRIVYAHTGWREVDGHWVFLHAGGALGPRGAISGVEVDLPSIVSGYVLPDPPNDEGWRVAVRNSLQLLDLGPKEVMYPILAAVWRSTLGACPVSLHLQGRTGVFKSQVAALALQHFGSAMDAEHLPGSWSSTDNALEGLLFLVKDGLLVIDDLAPEGTLVEVQGLHRKAARVFRAQGNRSARQRMRADTSLRPSKPPRGLLLSTGEDSPRGQSVRARVLILELAPGDVAADDLTRCQADAAQGAYARAMAGFLARVAPRYGEMLRQVHELVAQFRRDVIASWSHTRVPTIVAELGAGWRLFLDTAVQHRALDRGEAQRLWEEGWRALQDAGEAQAAHQEASDPVRRYVDLLASAVGGGKAHIATDAGSAPHPPEAWGWRGPNDPQGDRIGWLQGQDLYLDPNVAFRVAQKLAGADPQGLVLSPRALHAQLAQRGLLLSTDVETARGTFTVRRKLQGKRRQVLHLRAASLLPDADQHDQDGPYVA